MEGTVLASVQQQKYFMHLGSLSTKLCQHAYLHAVGKVRQAWQGMQESLFQLHYIIDLVGTTKPLPILASISCLIHTVLVLLYTKF